MMTTRLAIAAVLVIALPVLTARGMASAHDSVAAADGASNPASPAHPEWRAIDIDGRTWTPETVRGQVVFVDFWATWCAPCLQDLPRLKRLHAKYASRGLTIIGVSLDRSSVRDFRSWLQRQGIGWPQVREPGQFDGPLARIFAVDAIPASYLFDRRGRLHATALHGDALEARVAALVEER
jgi:thiol-disulfide isomerase/thioredoxin